MGLLDGRAGNRRARGAPATADRRRAADVRVDRRRGRDDEHGARRGICLPHPARARFGDPADRSRQRSGQRPARRGGSCRGAGDPGGACAHRAGGGARGATRLDDARRPASCRRRRNRAASRDGEDRCDGGFPAAGRPGTARARRLFVEHRRRLPGEVAAFRATRVRREAVRRRRARSRQRPRRAQRRTSRRCRSRRDALYARPLYPEREADGADARGAEYRRRPDLSVAPARIPRGGRTSRAKDGKRPVGGGCGSLHFCDADGARVAASA